MSCDQRVPGIISGIRVFTNPSMREDEMLMTRFFENVPTAPFPREIARAWVDELPALTGFTPANTHWDFPVAHPDMIDTNEIMQYVTRQNPLVIVNVDRVEKKESEKNHEMRVFMHQNLVKKSRLIGKLFKVSLRECPEDPSVFVAKDVNMKPSEVIAWAKEVRYASWGENGIKAKVRVIVPAV